jgi:hypothetical protein
MYGKTLWNPSKEPDPGKEPDKLRNLKIRRSPDISKLGAEHARQSSLESNYGAG